jgi:hypothetical protein
VVSRGLKHETCHAMGSLSRSTGPTVRYGNPQQINIMWRRVNQQKTIQHRGCMSEFYASSMISHGVSFLVAHISCSVLQLKKPLQLCYMDPEASKYAWSCWMILVGVDDSKLSKSRLWCRELCFEFKNVS